MNSKRTLLIAGLASAALVGSGLLIHPVFAQKSGTTGLVQQLATKFNLKESDVQVVFDQYKQTAEADREAKQTTRLDQAVKDGKLTAAQKDLILAKQKEVKAQMDALHNSTDAKADRKTAMDKIQTDLQSWAKQNSIDLKWVGPFGGRGHRPLSK